MLGLEYVTVMKSKDYEFKLIVITLAIFFVAFIAIKLFTGDFGIGADDAVQLPGGYRYRSESNYNKLIYDPHVPLVESEIIPCTVEDYAFNERFILAKQIVYLDCYMQSPLTPSQTDGEIKYWIINAETRTRMGPYDWMEYLQMRLELNIGEELTISE